MRKILQAYNLPRHSMYVYYSNGDDPFSNTTTICSEPFGTASQTTNKACVCASILAKKHAFIFTRDLKNM